jgi:N6-L-threonylcarbamoyladenine synthase
MVPPLLLRTTTAALLRSHRARLARVASLPDGAAQLAHQPHQPQQQQTRSAAAAAAAPLPPAREPLFSLRLNNGSSNSTNNNNEQNEERLILGIESSCDDTAAAVVTTTGRVLSAKSASQQEVHRQWGGVVPALARHAHRAAIDGVVSAALLEAGVTDPGKQLAAVAVTVGPGLSLCLDVGVRKARSVARHARVPLVPVHHMEAHALVARLAAAQEQLREREQEQEQAKQGGGVEAAAAAEGASAAAGGPPGGDGDGASPLPFPFLCLLVSGGHNLLALARGVGDYALLGTTLDDAAGEALDKVARMLGLPAAPHGAAALEALALEGDNWRYPFPPPMKKRRNCDFSYAGLKTSARMAIERELGAVADGGGGGGAGGGGGGAGGGEGEPPPESAERRRIRADLAASFQRAAVEHLVERTRRGVEWAREALAQQQEGAEGGGAGGNGSNAAAAPGATTTSTPTPTTPPPQPQLRHLVVAGGVACNKVVRARLLDLCREEGLFLVVPPPEWCTDNGVMVAWAGAERAALGLWEPAPGPLPVLSDEMWEEARLSAREAREQVERQYGQEAVGRAAAAAAAETAGGGGGEAAETAGGGSSSAPPSRDEAAALGEWVELRPRWPLTSEVAAGATGDVLSKKRADKMSPSLTDLTRRALAARSG